MSGRGKKINPTKNHRAWQEWMAGKKIGRRKQMWVWDVTPGVDAGVGHWEKV